MTEQEIFDCLKIPPTPVRSAVLAIVLSMPSTGFTAQEVWREKDRRKLPFTRNPVTHALRLFCVRGLIIECGERKQPKRGRPSRLLRLAPQFREAAVSG